MFGIANYGTFCLTVLIFLALPGPGVFALLGSTSKGGWRGGAAATAGLIVGDQVLMWLAMAGVAAVLKSHPAWFHVVQYGGACYLAWIGVRLLWPRRTGRQGEGALPVRIEPRHYARQSFLITLLNPKAIIFYMAFFPQFIHPQDHPGAWTFSAMATTVAAITAAYCLTLCSLARFVAAWVGAHRRLARALERCTGLVLIGFGLRLVRD